MSRSERSRRGDETKRASRGAHRHAQRDQPAEAATNETVRFEVRCRCGAVLRGQRAVEETTALCPGCGSELSLLPVQPEPPPAPPPAGSTFSPGTPAHDEQQTVGDLRDGAPTDSNAPPAIHPERLEQRRHLTWLRLGGVAVFLLVIATVYWGWRQRQRQRDLVELQSALNQGQAALDAGDVDRAVAPLARAARAAERLGGTSGQGQHARQLHREAAIWSDLPMTSIDDFFFDHAADAAGDSPDPLVAAFDRDLAGRSIVIQGRIARTTATAGDSPAPGANAPADRADKKTAAPSTAIALDWAIVGENFQVEIAGADLAGLNRAADAEVVFGAEIHSLERDPRQPGRWLVRLAPQSAVLLTADGPFAYYHWPDLEGVRTLLQRQRKLVLPAVSESPPASDAAPVAPPEGVAR